MPIGEYLANLQARIQRFERRYECSSAQMLSEVKNGRKETADISRWLQSYQVERHLSYKAVEKLTELCIEIYGPALRALG